MQTKSLPFRGAATALITPFCPDQSLDLPAFRRLIRRQLDAGIDALLILGTTGESPTITPDERLTLIRAARAEMDGAVPLLVGTGSNCTSTAVTLTRQAADEGADAVLVVTPYYNKATPDGLLAHYRAVAEASDCPVLAYHVPSRTGLTVPASLWRRIAELPGVVGIKEASGSTDLAAELLSTCGGLGVYCGSDECNAQILTLGGDGVISVLSNLLPREVHRICEACFRGDSEKAASEATRYQPLRRALFCEVNPIPVKTACAMLGWCGETMRLPLCTITSEHRKLLRQELEALYLLGS